MPTTSFCRSRRSARSLPVPGPASTATLPAGSSPLPRSWVVRAAGGVRWLCKSLLAPGRLDPCRRKSRQAAANGDVRVRAVLARYRIRSWGPLLAIVQSRSLRGPGQPARPVVDAEVHGAITHLQRVPARRKSPVSKDLRRLPRGLCHLGFLARRPGTPPASGPA